MIEIGSSSEDYRRIERSIVKRNVRRKYNCEVLVKHYNLSRKKQYFETLKYIEPLFWRQEYS
jgi:hypothetical protein